ncbi:MAG: endonuclease MutS2 [Streptococcaceae bacterium]|jgi:DNA mismatch repair protein MutS2|nr:endonuclease MutS2 [Streptococcaceae bacterium]
MNKKILDILEFDQVKAKFAPFLATAQGQAELSNLSISSDPVKIHNWLDELSEFAALVSENENPQLLHTQDLTEVLKRLELNATLSGPEFLAIKKILSATTRLRQYFETIQNINFPVLAETTDKLSDLSALTKLLSVFDEAGVLMDNASPALSDLRRGMKRDQEQIRMIMQDLLSKRSADLTENLITIRNERPVLPVRADSKSKIHGVVHDISSSGQTLYIEPSAAVERNNALNQKRIEEKNEIARIYAELSEKLVIFVPEIRQSAWVLGRIDLIHAKNEFLKRHHATIPEISVNKKIELFSAIHPLLDEKTAVQNDILFSENLNTIVITGPNTGGKTITIKTVGLLTLMAQAGLPITAAAGSSIAIFSEVYADIGDEQSIEQSLSTFSSHMTNLVQILRSANSDSLVLLDELGAGTDPKEGAALAQAILEELRRRKVKTLATTHYPELKGYGLETNAVSNASMEFDIERMEPTYRLRLGVPGRSNAVEISSRLGLAENVVQAAKELLDDGNSQDINALIERLEAQVLAEENKLIKISRLEQENDRLNAELTQEKKDFDREKARLKAVAESEAAEIASKARAEAQVILKQLNDKMQLKPHEVIEAMANLDKLMPDLSKNRVLKKAKADRGLREGAEVLVTSFGQHGRLMKLEKDGRWQVAIGSVTAKVDEADLEVLITAEKPKAKSKSFSRQVSSNIKSQLDLRGTRYEEAAMELDNYIDQALLANLGQITIVHGIGTGVIRDLVQKKLAKNKHIKSFAYAPMNAGGSGATIAVLK